MDNKKCQKNAEIYICEKCDFKCSKKSNYKQHLATRKHQMNNLDNEKNAIKSLTGEEERFVCSCGKSFKYQSGLCKHKKKCKIDCSEPIKETVDEPVNSSLIQNLIFQNKELQNMIVKQQSQYEDTLKEIIPKIGNTINNNQQYTIQMFLNDKCKNALNLEDFINSLQITLDDLDITTNRGLIEGVTYSVLKGLEKLQIHERPIHCSDLKREIMYIKDHDAWNRDQNNDMLKQSISKVADKQLKSFPKWEEGHPDYLDNDLEQEKYMQFMGNATMDLNEDPKAISKIIKNLGKEVYISKDNIVNEN
jgi:hypothetical protein